LIVEIRRASRGMMISTIFASLRFASYRRAVVADARRSRQRRRLVELRLMGLI